ncbi:MAG: hypothetical protein RML99_09825, partial [Anaerolineae bacterium]|nr:hypothetical protein [Anaerolineae bacterium]
MNAHKSLATILRDEAETPSRRPWLRLHVGSLTGTGTDVAETPSRRPWLRLATAAALMAASVLTGVGAPTPKAAQAL